MSRIGVLVLGAKAPRILGRVLEAFDDPRFRFLVHIDAKVDQDVYAAEMGCAGRVTFVEPRVKVFWGGFSMIEAELALLRAALADETLQSLVLVSDDCVPLRGPDEIYAALMEKPDRIAREVRDYTQEWYWKFHFPDSNFTSLVKHLDGRSFEQQDWENIQALQRARERGKKKLERVYFSRQWWAFSRATVTELLRVLDEDEHFVESFRYSMFADETMFATLHKICFPNAKLPDVPMYADYERPPVPFLFTRPHELPALQTLPADSLFIRKIWPWSLDVVDRIIKQWAPAVMATAAVEAADAYETSLAAAVELREDGDVEESVPLFEAALAARPGDVKATLEYAATLRKLKRLDQADACLDAAMALHPDNVKLRHAWAELPASVCDHDETVRRAEVYRKLFPPERHDMAWHNLAVQFGSLSESLRWDDIGKTIEAQRENAISHANALRICLWQATELCLADAQKAMVDEAWPEAWAQLPQEAKGNVRLRLDMIELNRKLVAETGVRLVSIGQNCLPFLLGGRWGLLPGREKPEETTPFDRGAFQKDNAAKVIESDFATFADRAAFSEGRSWDQQRLYQHDETGVYFYHERGVFWFDNEGERFFAELARMIATWRAVSSTGRRLFAFCLCGEGDLARLVEVMDRKLLGPEARLLVVDVLRQPHECPAHEYVTYLHVPYPANYVWDDFADQCKASGVGFEYAVMIAIMDQMMADLPEERAKFYRDERVRLLRYYATEAVAWKHDHENGAVLYDALHRLEPADREVAFACARALGSSGRVAQARLVLGEIAARGPADFRLRAAWVEAGVAPFDWRERLVQLRALREAFPPEREPRTWETVTSELKILTEHGEWDEAVGLIEARWGDFAARPKLFKAGINALLRLGRLELAEKLLDEAAPAALGELGPGVAGGVRQRLQEAKSNRALIARAGVRVLALGQNALPGMMITRWGLQGEQNYDAASPFDLGDFFMDTAAAAINDDLAAMAVREDYKESLAWGGGVVLRHGPSGVTFMSHRAAKIGEQERERFFRHLDGMIAYWRRVRDAERCVYVFFYADKGDAAALVAAAKAKLLGDGSKLVVVDQHEVATVLPADADVVFVHAPQPQNYPWYSGLGSATAENVAYERRVVAAVIEVVRGFLEAGVLVGASGG